MLRVASVPASHIYVRHLADLRRDTVTRLRRPVPADGPAVPDVYQRARRAALPRATWGSRRAEHIGIAQAHRAVCKSVLR